MTGASLQEVIGTHIADLYHLPPEEQGHLKKTLASGAWQGELFLKRKSGEDVRMFVSISTMRDADGVTTRSIVIGQEVAGQAPKTGASRAADKGRRSQNDGTSEFVTVVDRTGKILFVNHTVPGPLMEEIIGSRISDLVPQEERANLQKTIRRVFRTGKGANYEWSRPPGQPTPYQSNVGPIRHDGKTIAAVVIRSHNTSPVLSTETALTDAPWLRSLVEAMSDGVGTIDERGLITYANPKLSELVGYQREDLVGRPLADFLDAGNVEIVTAETAQQRSGQLRPFKIELIRRDGTQVPVIVSPLAVLKSDGQFKGTLSLFIDCTARTSLEPALRQDEERFRKLCEASIEGIVIHDRGEILDANPAFANMFGYEPAEVIGMHALEFTAPASRELLWQRIRSGDSALFEAVGLRKDGTAIPVEICGKTIYYQERIAAFVAIRDLAYRNPLTDAIADVRTHFRAELARITREVHGKQPIEDLARPRAPTRSAPRGSPSLSARELEVVQLLAQGLTNPQIAEQLHVSRRTIDHHVSHILTKLDAKNRTAAVIAAGRSGALDLAIDPDITGNLDHPQ